MRIAIIVEGKTEKAFMPHLRRFLETRLDREKMPKLVDPVPYNSRIPKEEKLKRVVEGLLNDGLRSADAVIALTDVYTGTKDFDNANDAKNKMCAWVGNNPRFHAHAAQYDFEAWLLPYWSDIKRRSGHNAGPPKGAPESINHINPPSYRIKEMFRLGKKNSYNKPREAGKILENNDLLIAINACLELKLFVNRIITLCDGDPIP